jgi:hypothetical protein
VGLLSVAQCDGKITCKVPIQNSWMIKETSGRPFKTK